MQEKNEEKISLSVYFVGTAKGLREALALDKECKCQKKVPIKINQLKKKDERN